MKYHILSLSTALVLLICLLPASASPSAAVKISRADSIWQSIDQTPSVATSAMSSTQMQMTRPLRYSVDTAIFKMKFSDTATIDTVDLVFITHKKKSVIKAARAALVPLKLTIKPDQIDQWVYHRMFCFHLRGQNDKWFEHLERPVTNYDSLSSFPDMTKDVKPDFPVGLHRLDTATTVSPRVLIDERGQARLAAIWGSSGVSALDDAALRAALKSKFRPAAVANRMTPIWVSYQVRFVP